jgi:hypothetical protein
MSAKDDLERLRAQGDLERARAVRAADAAERAVGEAASRVARRIEEGAQDLKWGAGMLLGSAVFFRLVKFRKGYRALRWLWALTPVLSRAALSRAVGRRGLHLFRRRNS